MKGRRNSPSLLQLYDILWKVAMVQGYYSEHKMHFLVYLVYTVGVPYGSSVNDINFECRNRRR
jgi:hypothetical protein